MLFFFFSNFSFSRECFKIENSVKYFYINGVLNNSEKDTRETSISLIKNSLKIRDMTLLYNPSGGIVEDIKETFSLINKNSYENKIFEENKKVTNRFYSKLSNDKINIIIAHSEGNLFAESLCLKNPDNKIIENISIAPPLNELKCNSLKTYVLFDNDHVIKQIEKFNNDFFYLTPTHKGTGTISHTIKSYLSSESVVSFLKSRIQETIDISYQNNFDFPIASLKIEDESFVEEFYNDVSDKKDDLILWGREKKAFLSLFKYSNDLLTKLNQKDFIKKVLNTEIPADN